MVKQTVNIHGKEYETVASRVTRFKESNPTYAIITKILERDDATVVMKAFIKDENDRVLATGHAEESRASSTINKTSAVENCETSAIGRALASFGLAGTEFASADEVANAIKQQGEGTTVAPQKLVGPATNKQRETIRKHLHATGVSDEDQPGHLIEVYGVEIPLTKEGASFVIGEIFATDRPEGDERGY